MASLISDSEKAELQTIFEDIFDTFKREITVHKEPKKVISSIDVNHIFGYGEPSQEQNITFVPRSKNFSATITYKMTAADTAYIQDINSYVPGDLVKIEYHPSDSFMKDHNTESLDFKCDSLFGLIN